MKMNYKIGGMTCGGCASKVQAALQAIPEVDRVVVDKPTDTAGLFMDKAVHLDILQKTLTALDPKYSITATETATAILAPPSRSWLKTYKPIILIFFYLLVVTVIIQYISGGFDLQQWMRHFMAGFFLVFSFFKLMDLSGFADSYKSYDIIAKRWNGWGYLYAFIELGLGVSFLLNCCPLATNLVAFTVMTISIIGVLQSVMNKQKIQCACLGAIFDLPMSTVTIIEDALMIAMSGYMIFTLFA